MRNQRIHVATRKGLFTIARKRGSWAIERTHFLGDNCTLVMHDPRPKGRGALFVALDHGHFGVKLHRSLDGGASWSEVGTPTYPKKPARPRQTKRPAQGEEADWALKLIWALAPGGADQEGWLWCGTVPGGLFLSKDQGETWRLNRPLWNHPKRSEWFGGGMDAPGVHSICVDPRDARRVALGVSCGGVWLTQDAGRSWAPCGKGMRAEFMPPERAYDVNIQDPHMLVRCPGAPDVFWVQHHNGIFRSTDAAASWEEIRDVAPSAFGFAVAVHPGDPDTAWFVPAVKDEKRIPEGGKVVVTQTRNGGKSFRALRKGLPQRHAYDLVLRHALDVDGAGNALAFGSTTGSLWISENGGESWETLSAHLPPVYAVRFEKASA